MYLSKSNSNIICLEELEDIKELSFLKINDNLRISTILLENCYHRNY